MKSTVGIPEWVQQIRREMRLVHRPLRSHADRPTVDMRLNVGREVLRLYVNLCNRPPDGDGKEVELPTGLKDGDQIATLYGWPVQYRAALDGLQGAELVVDGVVRFMCGVPVPTPSPQPLPAS